MKSKTDTARLEMPPDNKMTLEWLIKYVPFRHWAVLAGILLTVFGAGVKAGHWIFVHELVSRTEETKTQPVPSPVAPSPDPSVLAAKIEIRSPVNEAHVSGETTFAASVIDRPLSHYKMFWQVDNDKLNLMDDSKESGPHKEAKVNVTSWSWKKNGGPYAITFVALDSNGNRIDERSVNIFVDRK
jgi:hypothetical protein